MRPAVPAFETLVSTSTIWVLSWQAAVGREFLADPSMHARIRGRLVGAHQRIGRTLIDYVLLPTEIHALARIGPDDSAAGVARAFGNVLSRWVREVQPIRSPVLAGPYRGCIIPSIEALRDETRMLAWRPVHLGLCTTPTHYPHGALRIALGLTPARGLDSRPLLQHFGDSVPEARAALRRWIAKRPCDEEWRAWELIRGLRLATGIVGPRRTLARTVHGAAVSLIAAGGTYGVDGALRILEIWVAAKIHPTLAGSRRDGPMAIGPRERALVACLAVRHQLCSAASVARHFDRSKATLSEQMAACRASPADRQILATPVQRIVEESAALRESVR